MSDDKFSEKDVGAIIQRATELHAASAGGPGGLTLAEVEQIAAEMGVSAEHVRRAVAERGRRPEAVASFWKLPELRAVQTLPGALSDDEWATVVRELRARFGGAGTVEQIGQTRYWTRAVTDLGSEISRTEAALTTDGTTSVLDLRTSVSRLRFLAYFVAAILSAGAVGILQDGSGLPAALMFLNAALGAAAGVGAVRLALVRWLKKQRRSYQALTKRIAAGLAPLSPVEQGVATDAGGGRESAPDLDIDAAEGFGAGREKTGGRSRTR